MLNIRTYAAIDIGSNAVRLLVMTIIEQPDKESIFKKRSLVRVPIRLGADVFLGGEISKENIDRMIDTMTAFKLLMTSHKIETYRACATSAMREAKNGEEVANTILKKTGINIEIIDGNDEAAIIAATDLHNLIQSDKNYLYVDVGGGSTEFTFYASGKTIASKSFKLGTVRLLDDTVVNSMWEDVEKWIKTTTKPFTKIELIGSGGNINHVYKYSGKTIGKPLSYFYLSSYYQMLNTLTYEERITQLNMNTDRADVVIPAMRIYLSAMKWSRSSKIFVPKIGLADGIVKSLYNDRLKQS